MFAAAIDLFVERGYENVSLSDIAARIGLARNSLYRYFPDKAHILLRWFEQELPDRVTHSAAVLDRAGSPQDRIVAWAHEEIEYARTPEHGLIAQIGMLVPDLGPEARARLLTAHEELTRPLLGVLAEAGVSDPHRALVADLIQSLILAAARHTEPSTAGVMRSAGLSYLDRAIQSLVLS